MLYLIGLGLYDDRDISLKGAEALKKAEIIYAEFYTSRLFEGSIRTLENKLDIKIKILNREAVEEENIPIREAKNKDVAFICAGDPLIATTHTELMIQAKKKGIATKVVHSSSILTAAPGLSGLQAYKFGKVTTIPFPAENYFPHSPYLTIKNNLEGSMHTLVLLDIQAHLDRYMTANQGLEYLLKVEEERKDKFITKDTLAVVVARAGAEKPVIHAGKIGRLIGEDFDGPLHCLIIPSKLHIVEAEALVILAGAPESIVDISN